MLPHAQESPDVAWDTSLVGFFQPLPGVISPFNSLRDPPGMCRCKYSSLRHFPPGTRTGSVCTPGYVRSASRTAQSLQRELAEAR
eukprot:2124024-Amphidinium_carterae.1